jgi:hypothetical protein
MFDMFLLQFTQRMTAFAAQLVNPTEAQSKYLELDFYEKSFVDLLMLQVQNNVSTVRTFLDSSSKSKKMILSVLYSSISLKSGSKNLIKPRPIYIYLVESH